MLRSRLVALLAVALIAAGCGAGGNSAVPGQTAVLTNPILVGYDLTSMQRYMAAFAKSTAPGSAVVITDEKGNPAPPSPVLLDPECALSYTEEVTASNVKNSDVVSPGFLSGTRYNAARSEALMILRGHEIRPGIGAVGTASIGCPYESSRASGYIPVRINLATGAWIVEGYTAPGSTISIRVEAGLPSVASKRSGEIDSFTGAIVAPGRLARFAVSDTNSTRVLRYSTVAKSAGTTAGERRIYWFSLSDLGPEWRALADSKCSAAYYAFWGDGANGCTSSTSTLGSGDNGFASSGGGEWIDEQALMGKNPVTISGVTLDSQRAADDGTVGKRVAWDKINTQLAYLAKTASESASCSTYGSGGPSRGGTCAKRLAALKAIQAEFTKLNGADFAKSDFNFERGCAIAYAAVEQSTGLVAKAAPYVAAESRWTSIIKGLLEQTSALGGIQGDDLHNTIQNFVGSKSDGDSADPFIAFNGGDPKASEINQPVWEKCGKAFKDLNAAFGTGDEAVMGLIAATRSQPEGLGDWAGVGGDVFGVVASTGPEAYDRVRSALSDNPDIAGFTGYVGQGIGSPSDLGASAPNASEQIFSPNFAFADLADDAKSCAVYRDTSYLLGEGSMRDDYCPNGAAGIKLRAMPFTTDPVALNTPNSTPGLPFYQGPLSRITLQITDALAGANNKSVYRTQWLPTWKIGRPGPFAYYARGASFFEDPGRWVVETITGFAYNIYQAIFGNAIGSLARSSAENLFSVPALEVWKVNYLTADGTPVYALSALVKRPDPANGNDVIAGQLAVVFPGKVKQMNAAAEKAATGLGWSNEEYVCTGIAITGQLSDPAKAVKGSVPMADSPVPGLALALSSRPEAKCFQINELRVLYDAFKSLALFLSILLVCRYFLSRQIGQRSTMRPLAFLVRMIAAFALIFGMDVIARLLATIVAEVMVFTNLIGTQAGGGEPYSHLWLLTRYLSSSGNGMIGSDIGQVFGLMGVAPFALIGIAVMAILNLLRVLLTVAIVVISPFWVLTIMGSGSMTLFWTSFRWLSRAYLIAILTLFVSLLLFVMRRFIGGDVSGDGATGFLSALLGFIMILLMAAAPWWLAPKLAGAVTQPIKSFIQGRLEAANASTVNSFLDPYDEQRGFLSPTGSNPTAKAGETAVDGGADTPALPAGAGPKEPGETMGGIADGRPAAWSDPAATEQLEGEADPDARVGAGPEAGDGVGAPRDSAGGLPPGAVGYNTLGQPVDQAGNLVFDERPNLPEGRTGGLFGRLRDAAVTAGTKLETSDERGQRLGLFGSIASWADLPTGSEDLGRRLAGVGVKAGVYDENGKLTGSHWSATGLLSATAGSFLTGSGQRAVRKDGSIDPGQPDAGTAAWMGRIKTQAGDSYARGQQISTLSAQLRSPALAAGQRAQLTAQRDALITAERAARKSGKLGSGFIGSIAGGFAGRGVAAAERRDTTVQAQAARQAQEVIAAARERAAAARGTLKQRELEQRAQLNAARKEQIARITAEAQAQAGGAGALTDPAVAAAVQEQIAAQTAAVEARMNEALKTQLAEEAAAARAADDETAAAMETSSAANRALIDAAGARRGGRASAVATVLADGLNGLRAAANADAAGGVGAAAAEMRERRAGRETLLDTAATRGQMALTGVGKKLEENGQRMAAAKAGVVTYVKMAEAATDPADRERARRQAEAGQRELQRLDRENAGLATESGNILRAAEWGKRTAAERQSVRAFERAPAGRPQAPRPAPAPRPESPAGGTGAPGWAPAPPPTPEAAPTAPRRPDAPPVSFYDQVTDRRAAAVPEEGPAWSTQPIARERPETPQERKERIRQVYNDVATEPVVPEETPQWTDAAGHTADASPIEGALVALLVLENGESVPISSQLSGDLHHPFEAFLNPERSAAGEIIAGEFRERIRVLCTEHLRDHPSPIAPAKVRIEELVGGKMRRAVEIGMRELGIDFEARSAEEVGPQDEATATVHDPELDRRVIAEINAELLEQAAVARGIAQSGDARALVVLKNTFAARARSSQDAAAAVLASAMADVDRLIAIADEEERRALTRIIAASIAEVIETNAREAS